jgi:hypothetical protein
MMNDFAQGLVADVEKVTKKWRQQREREIRDANARSRRRDVFVRMRPITTLEAAWRFMEKAYMKASAGGTMPATPRQIMYAARRDIQNATGRQLDSRYFTQTILPDYVAVEEVAWDIVWDARGGLHEPHTNRHVPLGTLEVREYLGGQKSLYAPSEREGGWATKGAKDRYGAILFVEKEGFLPLFRAAKLAQRYDLAIMSSKGVSTTAARTLVDRMVQQGVPVFCIRDFDFAGFLIAGTLDRNTRRYAWRSLGAVDLGLRLDDVQKYELEAEGVRYRGRLGRALENRKEIFWKISPQLRENGATKEEVEFLIDRRVELNAFTSDQLIEWIERKLDAHGVKKVIPGKETLDAAVRGFVRDAVAERYLKILADDLAREVDAFDPGDIASKVAAMLAENPSMAWDEAVEEIVRSGATP